MSERIAFIGGGNMACAIIGGLLGQGYSIGQLDVVDPFPEAQDKLKANFGILAQAQPAANLSQAAMIIWAVKPQTFKEAALPVRFHTKNALHLSVAAGIRSDSIARWLDTERVVRAMPNTPALIGRGISGLFARPGVSKADRDWVGKVMGTTGRTMWLDSEPQLDAVTALSGSGPAYVFYFMEAMIEAGAAMGLSRDQAYKLAVATFIGTGELAHSSKEPPEILRQRVTSKGGTTYAALASMQDDNMKTQFIRAMHAAHRRAKELGDEFGSA
ncbi:MAG: pyrroline-5-carboxylate reductase [Rhodoferax sp.]|jgi:pyrroline-5-carboxylate reductase|nr:pyrroline-5-carboxylate reductase [Rhodoferax sp.]MBP9061196.1 pyrroline-5-carboxylate reductase [Rhodoferax sp.]MBP9684476.1 pyrroline-5-carboxylate reductase [Rhodoferax sp.]